MQSSLPYTKQSAHVLGILLLMTCLLAACSTKNVGHLPRQAISRQSAQTFQMQYMTLSVFNTQSHIAKKTSKQTSEQAALEQASEQASEQAALGQVSGQISEQVAQHTPNTLQLNIIAQIRTENLPKWVTQLELANLTIYLVDDEDTVIATYKATLPEQELRTKTHISLNVLIPLPEDRDPSTLSLAFGYRLPVRNAEKTRRIVLTEMAVDTK